MNVLEAKNEEEMLQNFLHNRGAVPPHLPADAVETLDKLGWEPEND